MILGVAENEIVAQGHADCFAKRVVSSTMERIIGHSWRNPKEWHTESYLGE